MKCIWRYSMNSPSMGRVATIECTSYTIHGGMVGDAVRTFKYCPYCGNEIEFINEV